MSNPICTCNGITGILTASVAESHSNTCSTFSIEAESTTLTIGNFISITMGYSDGASGVVFRGYVKQIEHKMPNKTVVISGNDVLVRATEFFIAPTDPNNTYKRSRIQAETVVAELLAMCGLALNYYTPTYFMLAYTGELEVNLVSVYDYCKMLSDLITWSVWADRNGDVYFKNRKPFPMYGTSGQPGDFADVALSFEPTSSNTLSLDYNVTDKDLRNRILVYGSGTQAESLIASPYLPSGFYRTAVIGAELMLDDYAACKDAADYNLALYNRLTRGVSMAVLGNHTLEARKCLNVQSSYYQNVDYLQNGLWYIFSCEHSFSNAGYVTNLELRIQ